MKIPKWIISKNSKGIRYGIKRINLTKESIIINNCGINIMFYYNYSYRYSLSMNRKVIDSYNIYKYLK